MAAPEFSWRTPAHVLLLTIRVGGGLNMIEGMVRFAQLCRTWEPLCPSEGEELRPGTVERFAHADGVIAAAWAPELYEAVVRSGKTAVRVISGWDRPRFPQVTDDGLGSGALRRRSARIANARRQTGHSGRHHAPETPGSFLNRSSTTLADPTIGDKTATKADGSRRSPSIREISVRRGFRRTPGPIILEGFSLCEPWRRTHKTGGHNVRSTITG